MQHMGAWCSSWEQMQSVTSTSMYCCVGSQLAWLSTRSNKRRFKSALCLSELQLHIRTAYLAPANVELEWLAPVTRGVELLTILQSTGVVHRYLLASLGVGGVVPCHECISSQEHNNWG